MSIPEPKVEHHEGRGIRSCPIFPELRPILDEAFEIFGDKSEYVVADPQYRAAANTRFLAISLAFHGPLIRLESRPSTMQLQEFALIVRRSVGGLPND